MRKTALGGVITVVLAGAVVMSPSVGAQARDREVTTGLFMGAGAEIGVSVRELTADEVSRARLDTPGGVFLVRVREESPAARAGMRSGDIIVSFDGERVRGVRHFSRLVLETPARRTVRSDIVREGARQTMTVTPEATERWSALGPAIRREVERGLRTLPRDFDFDVDRPVPPPRAGRARLGMALSPLTDQLASYFGVKEGVLVSAVDAGSPAAQAGVRAGDVITSINGRTVRTAADVAAQVLSAERGATLELRLVRDKQEMAVKVMLPEGQTTI